MSRSPLRAGGRAIAGVLLTGAFYLLLIDTTSLPELYLGAGAVLISLALHEAARRRHVAPVAISPAWLIPAWRLLINIPLDIGRLSLAALAQLVRPRAPRGALRAVPFRHGPGADPAAAGRRALAEALGSLAPNTIVIGIDRDRELILAHQLERSGGAETIDVLGLS